MGDIPETLALRFEEGQWCNLVLDRGENGRTNNKEQNKTTWFVNYPFIRDGFGRPSDVADGSRLLFSAVAGATSVDDKRNGTRGGVMKLETSVSFSMVLMSWTRAVATTLAIARTEPLTVCLLNLSPPRIGQHEVLFAAERGEILRFETEPFQTGTLRSHQLGWRIDCRSHAVIYPHVETVAACPNGTRVFKPHILKNRSRCCRQTQEHQTLFSRHKTRTTRTHKVRLHR